MARTRTSVENKCSVEVFRNRNSSVVGIEIKDHFTKVYETILILKESFKADFVPLKVSPELLKIFQNIFYLKTKMIKLLNIN